MIHAGWLVVAFIVGAMIGAQIVLSRVHRMLDKAGYPRTEDKRF